MKNISILVCGLAIACLLVPMFPQGQAISETPNVVVVMADDLEPRTMDILLNANLMPNFKEVFVNKGIEFSQSYTSFPLCCPSRATFLTGQYPHNHQVWSNLPPNGGVTKLDDSSTLATWLKTAGYHTAYVGKYLNGYGVNTAATYIPPGWDDWQATTGKSSYWYFGYTVNDNGVLVGYPKNNYQTDILAKRAAEAIDTTETNDNKPFFLYVNPLAPHFSNALPDCKLNYGFVRDATVAPRHVGLTSGIDFVNSMPPSFNEADVSDKGVTVPRLNSTHIACLDKYFHTRLESMVAVDDMIGQIVTTLTNNNEIDDTVIIFTSDNGFLMGEHRLHGKTRVYEEAIKVPLYINMPDTAAKTIDKLVLNNDIPATILDLAGASAGRVVDGRSLLPLIANPSIQWRNGILIDTPLFTAVHTGDYVYVYFKGGGRAYYDLDNDPYQLQNIGKTLTWKTKQALESWRTALLACKGATCKTAEDRPAV